MVNKLIYGDQIEVTVDTSKLKLLTRREIATEEIRRYWRVRGFQSKAVFGGTLTLGSIFLSVYLHVAFVLLVLFFGKYAFDNQFRYGYEKKIEEELGSKHMVRIDKA
ncbi:MAG: hypothetical protein HYW50_01715 [Candidatus Diapherotrites archaeon]|nr:hypothetical protein [Candidatus Diapherotrites archaeon]